MAKFLRTLYQFLMILSQPFLLFLLYKRVKQGKEIEDKLPQRYGYASLKRQAGSLVWLHSASLGETLALFPLIDYLIDKQHPFLCTTATTSAAQVSLSKYPKIYHQFVPIDHLIWVRRFLNFWRPSIAIWAESEFWPTILYQLKQRSVPIILLNGGISEKSLKNWQWAYALLEDTLNNFTKVYSRSSQQTKRLKKAGVPVVEAEEGNIKFLANPSKNYAPDYNALKEMVKGRQIWLAASTHGALLSAEQSEELQILDIHSKLVKSIPNILTFLAPRHPHRREQILNSFPASITVACRSLKQPITNETDVYLIDTLGELDTFFAICPVTFVGGSLVPIGGHNLLEPVQQQSVTLCGPYVHNAQEVFDALNVPWILASCAEDLYEKVYKLIQDQKFREHLHQQLQENIKNHQQRLRSILTSVETSIEKALNDDQNA